MKGTDKYEAAKQNHSAGASIGMVSILMIFVVTLSDHICYTFFCFCKGWIWNSAKSFRFGKWILCCGFCRRNIPCSDCKPAWNRRFFLAADRFSVRHIIECSVAENNALFSLFCFGQRTKNLMVVLSRPLDSNGIPSGELSVQKWQVEPSLTIPPQEEPVLNLASQPPLFTLKLRLFTIRNTQFPQKDVFSWTGVKFKIRCWNRPLIFLLSPAFPLSFKVNHVIEPQSEESCFLMQPKLWFGEFTSANEDIDRFLDCGDDDFSFSLPGVSRFRVSTYKQRSSLAAVIRVVTFDLPDPEKLGLPSVMMDLALRKKVW